MTVNVTYDEEVDRLISVRQASSVPLPPEISFLSKQQAKRFFARGRFYGFMGVEDHPIVRFLEDYDIRAAMAIAVSDAPYSDRLAHYRAWKGDMPVKIVVPGKDSKCEGESEEDTDECFPPSSPGPPPFPRGRSERSERRGLQ